MPTYRYRGYGFDGSSASGLLEADSQRAARELLRQQSVLPSELSEDMQAEPVGLFSRLRRRVPVAELSLFTRRLAILAAAAVPLHEAFTALQQQESHPELKAVLGRVRTRLAEGTTLARALGEEPSVFKENYVAMVAAGEAGGALDSVLLRLAGFLERQEALRRTVTGAMAYPFLMSLVGSGVMMFLLAFVIPKISGIFSDSKATLPLLTVALLSLSAALRKGWWLLLAFVCCGYWLYNRMKHKPSFMAARDSLLLRLPLIGEMAQTLVLARFASIMGLLLGSGVPLLKSLEIASGAVVNRAYQAVLHKAGAAVSEGASLASSLGSSSLFPHILLQLISVGERSGTLVESLESAGQNFEREFEVSSTRLVSLIEPLMILFMGLLVGLMVLAVLLPIFELNQLVR